MAGITEAFQWYFLFSLPILYLLLGLLLKEIDIASSPIYLGTSVIYITMNSCIFIVFFAFICIFVVHCYHLFYCSGCFNFRHWRLFWVASCIFVPILIFLIFLSFLTILFWLCMCVPVCVYICFFSGTTRSSSCIFTNSVLESASSPQGPGPFDWRMVFRNSHLALGMLIVTIVSMLLAF